MSTLKSIIISIIFEEIRCAYKVSKFNVQLKSQANLFNYLSKISQQLQAYSDYHLKIKCIRNAIIIKKKEKIVL